jgi:type I restriction enzyme M protein
MPPTPPHPNPDAPAVVLSTGAVGGRPTIELREMASGQLEAFLVSDAATPIRTGVVLTAIGRGYKLTCRIRQRQFWFKPEEVVRQMVLNRLIDDLGYSPDQIAVEIPIQMGSTVHPKPADIVVFHDSSRQRQWITIEVKKPRSSEGIEQLKSYMNATGSLFGYWTDGIDERFLLRAAPNDFSKPIWRLPRSGETLEDVDEPLTREKLRPIRDLHSVFVDIEQEILAHQSVDTFNEIFKIIFAKLYDERTNLPKENSVPRFKLGLTEDPRQAVAGVHDLFNKATQKWRDVYEPGERIALSSTNIEFCVKALQRYHLLRSGDVLGSAFESLVNKEMKGDMGQYFTPRQVVSMMAAMLNPRIGERICDPACGSGGFLIYPMRRIFEYINSYWDDPDDQAEQRKDYAQNNLIGIDNDHRLVRVAKAYMIMENDGRGGIHSVDSLDYTDWSSDLKKLIVGRPSISSTQLNEPASLIRNRQSTDGVDIVLTNPPFAGAIKAVTTLRQYDLASKPTGGLKAQVVRAVLFLERSLDLLRPGGRMAIVLPQGLFNNIGDQPVRDFIAARARILAVVGLHLIRSSRSPSPRPPYCFFKNGLAKASVRTTMRSSLPFQCDRARLDSAGPNICQMAPHLIVT